MQRHGRQVTGLSRIAELSGYVLHFYFEKVSWFGSGEWMHGVTIALEARLHVKEAVILSCQPLASVRPGGGMHCTREGISMIYHSFVGP